MVLFVRGCARSGTTLLADILNESSEIGIFVEQPLGDVARRMLPMFWFEDHVNDEPAIVAAAAKRAGKPRNAGSHYAPRDNRPVLTSARRYPTRERLAAILTAVVEASLEKPALRVIGSKTPGRWDAFEFDLVRATFERVKSVFVVRNPLETVNSIVNRRNAGRAGLDTWPDKDVIEAVRAYQESTCLLLSSCADDAGDCFVVEYDDLVERTDAALTALGVFLGVELSDRSGLVAKTAPKNVMTAKEEALVRAHFDRAIETWSAKRVTGPAQALGRTLDDCVPVLDPGATYRCDAPAGDRSFLGTGWSGSEPRGIWSEAHAADMFFAPPLDGEYELAFELIGYVPVRREPLRFAVEAGGRHFETILRNERGARLRLGPVALAAGRANRVRFVFDGLRSASERGIGTDVRRLGVRLRRFGIRKP